MKLSQLSFLMARYRHRFEDITPFFSYPLSLLLSYPEAQLVIDGEWVVARDFFGVYVPFYLGEGSVRDNPLTGDARFLNAACLDDLVRYPDARHRLVDWEFVYRTSSIGNMFRKRRGIINGCLNEIRVQEIDLLIWADEVFDIVRDWSSGYIYRKGQSDISAISMVDVLEYSLRNLELIRKVVPTIELGVFIRDKLVGFSLSLIERKTAFVVYEFLRWDWRRCASLLFYEMCQQIEQRRCAYINTLGHNGIETLRYNKNSYRPCLLIPQYRIDFSNYGVDASGR